MKSLKTFRQNNLNAGFALIEIVVALGILTFILSMGLFFNINSISQQNFFTEEELILSLLRTARSRAMNNINENSHGFFLTEKEFVLFEGEGDRKNEQFFERNSQVGITTNWTNNTLIFKNITGEPVRAGEITISDETKTFVIKVNEVGGID